MIIFATWEFIWQTAVNDLLFIAFEFLRMHGNALLLARTNTNITQSKCS